MSSITYLNNYQLPIYIFSISIIKQNILLILNLTKNNFYNKIGKMFDLLSMEVKGWAWSILRSFVNKLKKKDLESKSTDVNVKIRKYDQNSAAPNHNNIMWNNLRL